jgi:hypothetical protein
MFIRIEIPRKINGIRFFLAASADSYIEANMAFEVIGFFPEEKSEEFDDDLEEEETDFRRFELSEAFCSKAFSCIVLEMFVEFCAFDFDAESFDDAVALHFNSGQVVFGQEILLDEEDEEEPDEELEDFGHCGQLQKEPQDSEPAGTICSEDLWMKK